ncbi:hypothetical protein ABG067_002844 [Albugo candida]
MQDPSSENILNKGIPSVSVQNKACAAQSKRDTIFTSIYSFLWSRALFLYVLLSWFGSFFVFIICAAYALHDLFRYVRENLRHTTNPEKAIGDPVWPNFFLGFALFLIAYWCIEWILLTLDKTSNDAFLRSLQQKFRQYPYFNQSGVVFDGYSPNEKVHLMKDDRNLFAFHPHGVATCGWMCNGVLHSSFELLDIKWLVSSVIFVIPFLRNLMTWSHKGPVKKSHMIELMSSGHNIALLPGGFEEATLYKRNQPILYISKRAGFIKLALKFGYKIFPVYTFGEEQTYHNLQSFLSWRLALNRLKIPGIVVRGIWWCPLLPSSGIRLITVVGKPLLLPKISQPTDQDVQNFHAKYIQALQSLFDSNKAKYGRDPHAKLIIL